MSFINSNKQTSWTSRLADCEMHITEHKDDSETGEIQQKCNKTHALSRTIHTPNKPAELLNEPA